MPRPAGERLIKVTLNLPAHDVEVLRERGVNVYDIMRAAVRKARVELEDQETFKYMEKTFP